MGKDLKGKELGKGLSQRADGRYMARAVVDGENILLYGKNIAKLKKQFTEEKMNILNREMLIVERKSKMTLNEWYEEWFESYKKNTLKSTLVNAYRSRYNAQFKNNIGLKLLKDIKPIDVQKVVSEKICAGIKTSSIKTYMMILKMCLDAAVLNGYIKENPAKCVIIPKMEKSERRVLTLDEQNEFINYIENNDCWYEEMFKIMLLTGMRIGEVGGLKWEDIDFDKKEINIRRAIWYGKDDDGKYVCKYVSPKTKESVRIIPFFKETEEILLKQKEKTEKKIQTMQLKGKNIKDIKDAVFMSRNGTIVTQAAVYGVMKTIVEKINLENELKGKKKMEYIYPHSLRHTFATRCFEKDMSSKYIQEIMGHTKYDTTLVYTHLMEDKKKEELQKIGKFL